MADKKSSRPPTRERRVKSALARLTPPSSDARDMDKLLKKMTQERVNSAKANKTKHTSSTGVFAAKPARDISEEERKKRFATMYSLDYDGTYVPPPDLRPTSPTRRNNPHPSQQFMKWKIPSREIGMVPYEEGLELPPEYLARDENFDAIDDLSRNFGGLKLPPAQASSKDYGAYLHKRNPSRQGGARTLPVGGDVIQRVVTGGNEAALHEWLAHATPQEQNTILKMLKRAEEEKVKKTISTVMQPEAAHAVQGWLKDADEEEKEVAVRLFSSLGTRPGRPRSRSVGQMPMNPGRPLSRQPVPPPMPPPRPSGSAMGSRQRRLSGQQQGQQPKPQPWPAGIWHHKPVRDPPPQVYHRGSLFGTVREDASHFNIHPEWQDYFGQGDPVH